MNIEQQNQHYKQWCLDNGLNPKEGNNIRRYLEWLNAQLKS